MTKPCKIPYCECVVGKCTHPGFHDARSPDARGQALYEDQQGTNPAWDQLGDVTRQVWREIALTGRLLRSERVPR